MSETDGHLIMTAESIREILRDLLAVDHDTECTLRGRVHALDRDNVACYYLMADALESYEDGQIDRETYEEYHRDLWEMSIGISEATSRAFNEYMMSAWS